MRIVVTGANRGIGLELTRQFSARGDTVFALVRSSRQDALAALKGVSIIACDVADEASVRAATAQVPSPIDVLVNNAGMMTKQDGLESLRIEDALAIFTVNALGPLCVTRAFLDKLRAGKKKVVMHVTSGMGSIDDNTSGGYYAYRMSKAALNMAARSMSVDLRGDGISVAVINPGWVQTDMGGSAAPTQVGESAQGIIARIDELTLAQSGSFLDYRGKVLTW